MIVNIFYDRWRNFMDEWIDQIAYYSSSRKSRIAIPIFHGRIKIPLSDHQNLAFLNGWIILMRVLFYPKGFFVKHLMILSTLLIPISAYGMNLKGVQRNVPEFTRTLAGDTLVEYLCSNHFNCNSLDDQTAITLRAITKRLYDTLDAHRTQKIAAHKKWIADTATDPYARKTHFNARYFKPALVMQNDVLSAQWCITHEHVFLQGTKAKLDPSQHCTLLPDSLIIGPSGNTAYYCAIARKDGTSTHNIQLWKRYRFKLYADGTIGLKNKEPLRDRNFNARTDHKIPYSFGCYTNAEHTQLLALESANLKEKKTKKSTVICASARTRSTSYVHTHPNGFCHYDTPVFTPSFVSMHVSISPSTHPSYLAYQCEKGGATITCYEHFIALNDTTNLSIAETPLKQYLLQCPSKKVAIKNNNITPSPERLVHTFEPNERYPAELFEQWKAVAFHILHKKKVENPQEEKYTYERRYAKKYLNNLPLEDHARYYQIDQLINANHCGDSFAHRVATKRNEAATIYCDMYGSLHYIPETGGKRTQIDCHFFNTAYSMTLWLRHLVPIGPLPRNPDVFLSKNPAFALQCSAQEFITLIKEETLSCAQQTWDNGRIGAAWAFTNDGMHIRLYNLQTKNDVIKTNPIQNFYVIKGYNTIGDYAPCTSGRSGSYHLIDCYKIPHLTHGTITNIIYTEGAQPIFYVDGEKIEL